MKNPEKAIRSIKCTTSDIRKIEWCPTHPARIGFITKSAKQVQIREFPVYTMEKTEMEDFGVLEQVKMTLF